MNSNCDKYNIINKISISLLIIFLLLLVSYIIVYSILYTLTPCDAQKNLNFNIFNICSVKKYPEASQSYIQREIEREKEVFHIDNQNYTYKQAQKKCEAYNSVLATKNQIIKTFNKGANWCNYGWTEGQNAFYPVQKCMQENCGEEGINGGYFDEPNLKFGVNCYGIKPPNKNIEPDSIYCNETEKTFCEKTNNYNSCNKLDDDYISPFNKDSWSMYKA